jgi:hypothetical protein
MIQNIYDKTKGQTGSDYISSPSLPVLLPYACSLGGPNFMLTGLQQLESTDPLEQFFL